MDYTGVIGIVFSNSKYLLIFNKASGNTTFVSGAKEESDSTPLETMKRELLEETGLKPSECLITQTSFVHEFIYNSKKSQRFGMKAKQIIYLIEAKKTDLKPIDSDSEINGWFTYEDTIKELSFDDSKELFKKVVSQYNL